MKNQNPIYIWSGLLPCQDANTPIYFGGLASKEDKRNAIPEHPTKCLKALMLRRWFKIKHALGVIVLRRKVFILYEGAHVWTRYNDGAAIQRAVDRGEEAASEMFALRPPERSNKPRGASPREHVQAKPRKTQRLRILREMLAERQP